MQQYLPMYGETDEPICVRCGRACTERQGIGTRLLAYGEVKEVVCEHCIRRQVENEQRTRGIVGKIVSKCRRWVDG